MTGLGLSDRIISDGKLDKTGIPMLQTSLKVPTLSSLLEASVWQVLKDAGRDNSPEDRLWALNGLLRAASLERGIEAEEQMSYADIGENS